MARSISNASMVSAVLKLCFDTDAKFADYGGGQGIFVRMMRDRGFDFYRDKINLLTRKKGQAVPFGFRLATIQYISRLINLVSRKRSLTAADYKQLTGVELVNR